MWVGVVWLVRGGANNLYLKKVAFGSRRLLFFNFQIIFRRNQCDREDRRDGGTSGQVYSHIIVDADLLPE